MKIMSYLEFKLKHTYGEVRGIYGVSGKKEAYDIYKKQEEDKMNPNYTVQTKVACKPMTTRATSPWSVTSPPPVPTQPISVSYAWHAGTLCVDDYGSVPLATDDCCKSKEKKENNMTNDIEFSQRDHLTRRITNVDYDKSRELRKTFNLDVDNSPKTYKDLIEKIQGGQYTLDEKKTKRIDAEVECGNFWGYITEGIIWTGEKTPDFDGYEAAKKELAKAKTVAMDAAKLLPVSDGLKALNDLEAWTPTGKAN